jgi:hypothetical protein
MHVSCVMCHVSWVMGHGSACVPKLLSYVIIVMCHVSVALDLCHVSHYCWVSCVMAMYCHVIKCVMCHGSWVMWVMGHDMCHVCHMSCLCHVSWSRVMCHVLVMCHAHVSYFMCYMSRHMCM